MKLLSASLLFAGLVSSQKWLVVFKENTSTQQQQQHKLSVMGLANISKHFSMGSRFAGYAAEISAENIDLIRSSSDISYVEADKPLFVPRSPSTSSPRPNSTSSNSSHPSSPDACRLQTNVPSWGLSRVSQDRPPLSQTYSYTAGDGDNTVVFVMDTGIRVTHNEFEGRASFGYNNGGGSDTDVDGHGTHVAGTVAAQHYGVCKSCDVVAVKVFDDSGASSESLIIDGLNWIFNNFKNYAKNGYIINMSLGGNIGQTSQAMDDAVNTLVAAGVHVVAAAGNENTNACGQSPARAKDIIAVGATTLLSETTDFFLGGSNFGPCVKILAPGHSIVSLGISSDTAVGVVEDGTSMASPHVAGVLARFVSLHPDLSLPEQQEMMLRAGLKDRVGFTPTATANLLVHKACI